MIQSTHLLLLFPFFLLSLLTPTQALPQTNTPRNTLTCGVTTADIAFKSASEITNVQSALSMWATSALEKRSLLPSVKANHKANSCIKPFMVRGTVTLGMCVGDHGGGHAGIVWEVDEIVQAVNRMIEACQKAGLDRVKGMAEIGGTRGGVWIGYRDVSSHMG